MHSGLGSFACRIKKPYKGVAVVVSNINFVIYKPLLRGVAVIVAVKECDGDGDGKRGSLSVNRR